MEYMTDVTGIHLSPNKKLTVNLASNGATVNTNSINGSKTTGTDYEDIEGAFASGFCLPNDHD